LAKPFLLEELVLGAPTLGDSIEFLVRDIDAEWLVDEASLGTLDVGELIFEAGWESPEGA
jgi:hypothetical protein